MLESADDLAVFFNTDEFAVAATYNGVAVTVIFDDAEGRVPARAPGPAGEVGVQTLALFVRRSEVASPAAEDTVVIASGYAAGTYKVRDRGRDIDGAVWRLTLRKVS